MDEGKPPALRADRDDRKYFHSPVGGDSNGVRVKGYYNPRTGTLEKRQMLTEAAARLFAERGVAGTAFASISQEAGLVYGKTGYYFHGLADILAELLTRHLLRLAEAVAGAADRYATAKPEVRLEALVMAHLEHVAQEAASHRTLLFCAHLLDEQRRESVRARYRVVLDTIMDAVAATVPVGAEARKVLRLTLRDLLSPAREWGSMEQPAERRARARRIVGMMLAAAEAEAVGQWVELGSAEGGPLVPRRVTVESRALRGQLRVLMDEVADGAEVVVTRRGVPAARLVGMRAAVGAADVHRDLQEASDVHPALTDDSAMLTSDSLVARGTDVHRDLQEASDVHLALTNDSAMLTSDSLVGRGTDVHRDLEEASDVHLALTGYSWRDVSVGVDDGDWDMAPRDGEQSPGDVMGRIGAGIGSGDDCPDASPRPPAAPEPTVVESAVRRGRPRWSVHGTR